MFKNNSLKIIFRYVKFNFSYQEKILHCSNVLFCNMELIFRNIWRIEAMMRSHRTCINSVHQKMHLKKTTFTYEKNRFSLGKHSVLN